MFDEEFEKLSSHEQEQFKQMINYFLAHTYLTSEVYNFEHNVNKQNPDYIFVRRFFDLFNDYLAYAGMHLENDSNYGVIQLCSTSDANRIHLDKLTTYFLYALRLMYEEEREKLSLNTNIIISTRDLVQKLLTLGTISKKPANNQIHNSLSILRRFRLIDKQEGNWENPDTRIIILPTILFVITNQQVNDVAILVGKNNDSETEEEEDEVIETSTAD